MNLEDMQAKIFKALAHPIRLRVIKKLSYGTLCVCDLKEDLDFSQANLSQHLKILRDANLIDFNKDGLKVFYYIKQEKFILDIMKESEKIIHNYIELLKNNLL